jgi:hypothetical protein
MAASYPSAVKSFSTKSTTDIVEAAHPNDLQDEVTAIETALLSSGLAHHLFPDATTRTLGTSSKPWGTTYLDALLYINDSANANMTRGLTINQAGADDQILAFKSSDIAHGMTALAETDTYGAYEKISATDGGLLLRAYSEGTRAAQINGYHTTDNTTKSTAADAVIRLQGALKSGTSSTAVASNANLLTIANDSTVRFILDGDGDSHQDVGTAWTEFDAFDDLALLDDLNTALTGRDRIKRGFRAFLQYNRAALERARLVTFNRNGHHFVNMSKLTMAHTGAIRQLGRELRTIKGALVESQLLPAEAR